MIEIVKRDLRDYRKVFIALSFVIARSAYASATRCSFASHRRRSSPRKDSGDELTIITVINLCEAIFDENRGFR